MTPLSSQPSTGISLNSLSMNWKIKQLAKTIQQWQLQEIDEFNEKTKAELHKLFNEYANLSAFKELHYKPTKLNFLHWLQSIELDY